LKKRKIGLVGEKKGPSEKLGKKKELVIKADVPEDYLLGRGGEICKETRLEIKGGGQKKKEPKKRSRTQNNRPEFEQKKD